jgi:hypothetical protein
MMRSDLPEIEDKMNALEWVSRTAPFLSPDAIARSINAFKELYNTSDANKRNSFVKAQH